MAVNPKPPKVVLDHHLDERLPRRFHHRPGPPGHHQEPLRPQGPRRRRRRPPDEPLGIPRSTPSATYTNAPGDTIEIDCEYRSRIALVKWSDHYTLVDNEGTVLPEQFTEAEVPRIVYGSDGKMNIRVIDGVAGQPLLRPALARRGPRRRPRTRPTPLRPALRRGHPQGQRRQLPRPPDPPQPPPDPRHPLHPRHRAASRPEARQAQGRLHRGRPHQKLNYLASVYAKYHRVDAGQPWLDLRFDHILYPAPDASDPATQASSVSN